MGCKTFDCKVSIKSHNGKYVAAEEDASANANHQTTGPLTTWTVTYLGDDQVRLQGNRNRRYLGNMYEDFENANKMATEYNTYRAVTFGNGKLAFKLAKGKYMYTTSNGFLEARDYRGKNIVLIDSEISERLQSVC